MSTLVSFHLLKAGLQVLIQLICLSMLCMPGVTAPQECIVMPSPKSSVLHVVYVTMNLPPMLDAAIPVLAVIEITAWFLEYFFLKADIIARSSNDFPEPSQP